MKNISFSSLSQFSSGVEFVIDHFGCLPIC